jgi:hypothetical protein
MRNSVVGLGSIYKTSDVCVLMVDVIAKEIRICQLELDRYLGPKLESRLAGTFNFTVRGDVNVTVNVRGDQAFIFYNGVNYEYDGNEWPDFHKRVSWSYMTNRDLFLDECKRNDCDFAGEFFLSAKSLVVNSGEITFSIYTNEIVPTGGGSHRMEKRLKTVIFDQV